MIPDYQRVFWALLLVVTVLPILLYAVMPIAGPRASLAVPLAFLLGVLFVRIIAQ